MTVLWRALLVTASLAAAVALAYTVISLQYAWGTMAQPGTGFYPFWVGVAFIASAVGVGWEAVKERPAEPVQWPGGVPLVRVIGVVGISAAYMVLLVMAGHALAGGVATWAFMRLMGVRHLLWTTLFAIVVGLATAFLFIDLLGVPLPSGIVFD